MKIYTLQSSKKTKKQKAKKEAAWNEQLGLQQCTSQIQYRFSQLKMRKTSLRCVAVNSTELAGR